MNPVRVELSVSETLQALAAIKEDNGIKCGGSIPIEYYKQLSFRANVAMRRHFQAYANDLSIIPGDTWRTTHMITLPQDKDPETFHNFRWIGKCEVLPKWYLGSLVPE